MSERFDSKNITNFEESSPPTKDDLTDYPSLDEAIEFCVGKLESNKEIEPDELIARFPRWASELAEFIENWSGMEHYAQVLATPVPGPPDFLDLEDVHEFGDYELIKKIGAGGMGVIFQARQKSLDRLVAVKMVSGQHRDRDRFRIEAEAAAALSHPNIVPIYEIGEHRNRLFFSMRLVEGGSLRDSIERETISSRDAAKIVSKIARAVSYAHQHGILHRDLKPANVLIDFEKQPHITDFGLAKLTTRDTEITRTGAIMGTPGYMAPEQAVGKSDGVTTATDVYGVGAILYALLTGKPPFEGESSLEILRRVMDESPVPPRNLQPAIARDLETICLKCLSKEPASRYNSADLLADDLDRYLNHQPVKARPITSTERFWRWCRRNPAIALLSGAVVLLLLTTTISSSFLALSERNARLQAEANGLREQNLKEKANKANTKQVQSAEDALRAQADLCLNNGLWQSKQDNHGEAALWFAEAARLTGNEPRKLQDNQLRFQSWFDRQPVPIAAKWMENGYREMEVDGKRGQLKFRPHSNQLLCIAGSQFVVWDHDTDSTWDLTETYPDITQAQWSGDGRLLAIGRNNGTVSVLNSDARNIQWELDARGKIEHLSFSRDDRLLAVATQTRLGLWNAETQTPVGKPLVSKNRIMWIGFGTSSDQLVSQVYRAKYQGFARVYNVSNDSIDLKFEISCRADNSSEERKAFRPKFVAQDRFLVVRSNDERPEKLKWIDLKNGEVARSVDLETHKFSVDVSSDGQQMITGDEKTGVTRWFLNELTSASRSTDEATMIPQSERKREFSEFRTSTIVHTDRVNAADINDESLIATGSWDFSVQLWAVEDYLYGNGTAQRLRRLATLAHQARIRQVQFSPDGTRLVTAQVDGLIRVWKLPNGSFRKQRVRVPTSGALAKIVDHQNWMISGMPRWTSAVSEVSVFDIESGDWVGGTHDLSQEVHGWVMDSCCLPDNGQIVTLHANPNRNRNTYQTEDGTSGTIRFWNLADGQSIGEEIRLNSEPRWIAKHPAGDQVAVCLANMEVVLVNTQTMEVEDTLVPVEGGDSNPANSHGAARPRFVPQGSLHPTHRCNQQLTYSPDGKSLAVWSTKQTGLWVWDIDTRRLQFCHIEPDHLPINRVEYSPNGQLIAIAGGRNNTVRILDSRTGARVVPDLKHLSVVYYARFSPDSGKVVVASRDGIARVFDIKTGKLLLSNMSHSSDVVDAAFTPDSRFILTLGADQLRVWHASDGTLAMKPIAIPNRSRQIHITADSRHVYIAAGLSEIAVFDLDQLQHVNSLTNYQMRLIGELLSCKRVSQGTVVKLATPDWFERWKTYRRNLNTGDGVQRIQ